MKYTYMKLNLKVIYFHMKLKLVVYYVIELIHYKIGTQLKYNSSDQMS